MGLSAGYTLWVLLGSGLLITGVVLDAGAALSSSWGQQEHDTFYTYVGLFQMCNGTRELTRRDRLEIWRNDPHCVFPTEAEQAWLPVGLGMELVGALFSLATLVTVIVLLISIKLDWLRSRSALVALIPISCLAGFFNVVGAVVWALNVPSLDSLPSWGVWIDAAGAACSVLGAACCVLDLQGCCHKVMIKQQLGVGSGLLRQI